MKKISLILIGIIITINVCLGQTNPSCDSVVLKTSEQIKDAQPCVLIAANDLLSKPIHGNLEQTSKNVKLILAWMEKTPNYSFTLNKEMMKLCEGDNTLLFRVYITCLAKAALEGKKDFVPDAIKLFVDYVKKTDNKVEQTSKIKRLIEDFDNKKIDKYVK